MYDKNQQKQRLIKLIHVAKRDLGMDDDVYRSILLKVGNKQSSKDLTISELEAVLEHFKKIGFKVIPKNSTIPMAKDAQSKMIRGLWLELADLGAVRDPSENALRKFVKRMTNKDALQFLSMQQASQVIENLKQWKIRTERSPTS